MVKIELSEWQIEIRIELKQRDIDWLETLLKDMRTDYSRGFIEGKVEAHKSEIFRLKYDLSEAKKKEVQYV